MFAKMAFAFAVIGALACAGVLVATANGSAFPYWLLITLFTTALLSFLPALYVHYKLLIDEKDWFSSGIYALLRQAPFWLIAIWAFCITVIFVAAQRWSGDAYMAAFLLSFHATSAVLMYVVARNLHLVFGGTCPNGHPTKYYNRFCPICGALLSRRRESA